MTAAMRHMPESIGIDERAMRYEELCGYRFAETGAARSLKLW